MSTQPIQFYDISSDHDESDSCIIIDEHAPVPVPQVVEIESPSPHPFEHAKHMNEEEEEERSNDECGSEMDLSEEFQSEIIPDNDNDDDDDDLDSIDELSVDETTKALLKKERIFLDNYERTTDYSSPEFTEAEPSDIPLLHTLIVRNNDSFAFATFEQDFEHLEEFHYDWKTYVANLFINPEFSPLRLHFLKSINSSYIESLIPCATSINYQSFADAIRVENYDVLNYWRKQLSNTSPEEVKRLMNKDAQRQLLFKLVKYGIRFNDTEPVHSDVLFDKVFRILHDVLGYTQHGLDKHWFPMSKAECFYHLNMYLVFCGHDRQAINEISDGLWNTSFEIQEGVGFYTKEMLTHTPLDNMSMEDFVRGINGMPISISDLQRMEQSGVNMKDLITTLLTHGPYYDLISAYYDARDNFVEKLKDMEEFMTFLFLELSNNRAVYLKYVNENLMGLLKSIAGYLIWTEVFILYLRVYASYIFDEREQKLTETQKKLKVGDFCRSLLNIYYDPSIARTENPATLIKNMLKKVTVLKDTPVMLGIEPLARIFNAYTNKMRKKAATRLQPNIMGADKVTKKRPADAIESGHATKYKRID